MALNSVENAPRDALDPTAGALDLLTAEEIDNALESIRGAVARMQKVVPKLKARQQGLGRGACG